jgi:pimeloyl-ACP methyl ester carboxylesterase
MDREELTFASGADHCAAWHYPPAGDDAGGRAPCVVMAHGFSLTRHDGLPVFAEALAAAGAHVLVFDHRGLGDSGGEPGRFRKAEQLADWRAAVALARGWDGVDPARIILWGYSFSGGHAVTIAHEDPQVAGVLLLCPFLDGLARVLSTPPGTALRILPKAFADIAGSRQRIAVTGQPGSHAAMSLPGEGDGFAAAVPEGSPWRNEIGPGLFATVALHRPVRYAPKLRMPVFVGLGERDISVSRKAVERFAQRAPAAELHRYPGDHFEVLMPDAARAIAADQVAFAKARGLVGEPVPA